VDVVTHSPWNSIYSIFCALWGTLFIIFWKRRSRGLQIEWDNHSSIYQEDDIRKEFQGIKCINPVTDKEEAMFTHKQRLSRYIKSLLMCSPHFAAIILLNIIFLNLTGVINPQKHHALFQIEFLSGMCEEGKIFDPNSMTGMLPSIV
jgi:hypothetical protein